MANTETDCYTFDEPADGNISVVLIATTACGAIAVTNSLKVRSQKSGLTLADGAIKTHIFSGTSVKF